MSTWTAPTSWLSRHYGTASDDVIAMHDEGPATALCWLGWRDGEPRVSLGILDDRGAVYALSDDPAQWDLIGQVVPRESWPGEMYAGKRVGEHDAPADLRALLDAAIAEYRAEAERRGDLAPGECVKGFTPFDDRGVIELRYENADGEKASWGVE